MGNSLKDTIYQKNYLVAPVNELFLITNVCESTKVINKYSGQIYLERRQFKVREKIICYQ